MNRFLKVLLITGVVYTTSLQSHVTYEVLKVGQSVSIEAPPKREYFKDDRYTNSDMAYLLDLHRWRLYINRHVDELFHDLGRPIPSSVVCELPTITTPPPHPPKPEVSPKHQGSLGSSKAYVEYKNKMLALLKVHELNAVQYSKFTSCINLMRGGTK